MEVRILEPKALASFRLLPVIVVWCDQREIARCGRFPMMWIAITDEIPTTDSVNFLRAYALNDAHLPSASGFRDAKIVVSHVSWLGDPIVIRVLHSFVVVVARESRLVTITGLRISVMTWKTATNRESSDEQRCDAGAQKQCFSWPVYQSSQNT